MAFSLYLYCDGALAKRQRDDAVDKIVHFYEQETKEVERLPNSSTKDFLKAFRLFILEHSTEQFHLTLQVFNSKRYTEEEKKKCVPLFKIKEEAIQHLYMNKLASLIEKQ